MLEILLISLLLPFSALSLLITVLLAFGIIKAGLDELTKKRRARRCQGKKD